MYKIIKATEVQRRQQARAKAKLVMELQRRRRKRANNTLAILMRLRKEFDSIITDVFADQGPGSFLIILPVIIDQMDSLTADLKSAWALTGGRKN
jgi:hypothetical protein